MIWLATKLSITERNVETCLLSLFDNGDVVTKLSEDWTEDQAVLFSAGGGEVVYVHPNTVI